MPDTDLIAAEAALRAACSNFNKFQTPELEGTPDYLIAKSQEEDAGLDFIELEAKTMHGLALRVRWLVEFQVNGIDCWADDADDSFALSVAANAAALAGIENLPCHSE